MLRARRIAKKILSAASDSAYGSDREQLAHELFDWHGGQASGLHAVATAWLGSEEALLGDIDRALTELQDLLDDEVPHGDETGHVRELRQRLEAEKRV